LDHLPGDPFKPEFEKRPIMDFEQPVRDVDAEIWVNPDQVGIERRMMDLGQRQAIRDDRLPQLLIGIHDDVSGTEQTRLGQMGDRTAACVGAQDGISE
jgi:hypothetical protein